MSEVFYDSEGNVLGHVVDGKPVFNQTAAPVPQAPPVPTGDAFDELLDNCLRMMTGYLGKVLNKLAPELRSDQNGVASTAMLRGKHPIGFDYGHGGIVSWIREGTLRSSDELSPVLREYVDMMTRRVRLQTVDASWQFDNRAMKWCSQKFGAPVTADPPAKTPEQIAADAETKSAEIRRNNADVERQNQELAEYEVELDKQLRVKRLLKKLATSFFTADDIWIPEAVDAPTPPELWKVRQRREVFRLIYEGVVARGVANELTDEEIMEKIEEMNQVLRGSFRSWVPEPQQSGEVRQYFTGIREATEFWATHTPEQAAHLQVCMDGRFCVTIKSQVTDQKEGE
jgi:hypothetical protein